MRRFDLRNALALLRMFFLKGLIPLLPAPVLILNFSALARSTLTLALRIAFLFTD